MAAGIQLHDVDTVLDCRLLIAHPTDPRVLTVRQAKAWALPALTPLEHHVAAVSHINLAVFRLFGLRTHIRRLVLERSERSPYRSILRIYELEVIGELARQRIERTAWAGRDVLDEMEFVPGSDRDVIEKWLEELESDYPDVGGPPWTRPGWFEIASTWMQRQAAAAGTPCIGVSDQHWTDDSMNVLAAVSEHGTILMTATGIPASRPAQDPGSSGWASRFGWTKPELIASDANRNWHLYRTDDATGV